MYLGQLEALLARVHPAIRALRIEQVAGDRDTLAVVVDVASEEETGVLAALKRSEPSLRPKGYAFAYRISA